MPAAGGAFQSGTLAGTLAALFLPRPGSASYANASASSASTTTAAMMPMVSVPMRLSGTRVLTSQPTESDAAITNAGPAKPKPLRNSWVGVQLRLHEMPPP